jgi:hypothetical protein
MEEGEPRLTPAEQSYTLVAQSPVQQAFPPHPSNFTTQPPPIPWPCQLLPPPLSIEAPYSRTSCSIAVSMHLHAGLLC